MMDKKDILTQRNVTEITKCIKISDNIINSYENNYKTTINVKPGLGLEIIQRRTEFSKDKTFTIDFPSNALFRCVWLDAEFEKYSLTLTNIPIWPVYCVLSDYCEVLYDQICDFNSNRDVLGVLKPQFSILGDEIMKMNHKMLKLCRPDCIEE
jgi:hypothetical protein